MKPQPVAGESNSPSNKPKARLRVLVVEDHAATRAAMSRVIRQAGAEVTTARDGEEALGYLLTSYFDVLLTDLRMPKIDGFELMHHCERMPAPHRPKRVIAISGEYDASALQGHPAQFLAKPLDLEALLNMLAGRPN